MVSEFETTVMEYLQAELADAAAEEHEDLLRKARALLNLEGSGLAEASDTIAP